MDFEKEINLIKERNLRVEADKAWETSFLKTVLIACITYIIASIVMYYIGVQQYFLNALIPTIGYIVSTQSIPVVKRLWIKRYLHK